MRKTLILCVAVISILSLVRFTGASSADKLSKGDKDSIKDLMRNTETLAWESRLARTNSDNDDVKHFAEEVIGGADKMIRELHDLGDKYNFSFEADPTKPDVREKKDMEKLKGKKFDRDYLDSIEKQLEEELSMLKHAAKADNDDLRTWAGKKDDAVRKYLDMNRDLKKK